jgi:hypothetical protein
MANRNSRKSGKNRREQTPKAENKAWRDARLQHSNMNLTRPSGKVEKRPNKGARGRDW